jgi:hypothetical protein
MGASQPRSILTAIALLAPLARGADAPAERPSGWRELSLLNPAKAQREFAAALASDPSNRAARLGEALTYLQQRARTPENVAAAGRLLADLRRENAGDDTGIAAGYYLARIEQVHSFTPNRAAAIAGYRALLADHPGHHYAQLAAPKLALLLLYDDVTPDEWERRVAEIQALIPRLTAPEAIRDTQLTLATAFLRLRHDQARALPLFASCLAAGSVTRTPRLNTVLVQAAESAAAQGEDAAAAAYYGRFLVEFPQDSKSDEIRRRLSRLVPKAAP